MKNLSMIILLSEALKSPTQVSCRSADSHLWWIISSWDLWFWIVNSLHCVSSSLGILCGNGLKMCNSRLARIYQLGGSQTFQGGMNYLKTPNTLWNGSGLRNSQRPLVAPLFNYHLLREVSLDLSGPPYYPHSWHWAPLQLSPNHKGHLTCV